MQDILLEVENLSVSYGDREILHQIKFALARGEVLAVVGASGSGKSTLLNAIMGLIGKNGQISGSLKFKGQALLNLNAKQWRKIRGKEIGMVYQDAGASFSPIRKIGDQLYELVHVHKGWSMFEMREQAEEILEKMQLPKDILDEYPFCLSGGMAQRIGILSALLLKPALFLADEPTSALDTITQMQVVKEMMNFQREYGLSVLLVTHQLSVARSMADSVIIMYQGRIVEAGPCCRVFEHPQHAYTKKLLVAESEKWGQ